MWALFCFPFVEKTVAFHVEHKAKAIGNDSQHLIWDFLSVWYGQAGLKFPKRCYLAWLAEPPCSAGSRRSYLLVTGHPILDQSDSALALALESVAWNLGPGQLVISDTKTSMCRLAVAFLAGAHVMQLLQCKSKFWDRKSQMVRNTFASKVSPWSKFIESQKSIEHVWWTTESFGGNRNERVSVEMLQLIEHVKFC